VIEEHKRDVALCVLALVATVVVACDSKFIKDDYRPSSRGPGQEAADSDRAAEKSLAASKTEAREWLAENHDKHVVWKWNKQAARKAIDELYSAGAKEVWIVDTSKAEGGVELASEFVIVLPADAAPRKKVFDWIARWEKQAEIDEEDRTKDGGQKYFVLSTDL